MDICYLTSFLTGYYILFLKQSKFMKDGYKTVAHPLIHTFTQNKYFQSNY